MRDQVRSLPRRALAGAVLIIAAFALAGYSFWANHQAGCQARNTTLNVMTEIVLAAQQQTDSDPTVPAAKKAQSDAFVQATLARIEAARCG